MNQRQQPAAPAAQTQTTEAQQPSILDRVIDNTQRAQSITATAASFLGVPPAKVCALLRNVWKTSKDQPELTDQEMFQGLSMIARFGLDPVAKEVYVTRSSKGLMTIIGIDGFVKILDRTDHFDGFEQELGWSADGKTLEWVETIIYSKKRSKPTRYKAFAEEYSRLAGIVAKQIPWHMLRLFSLRHATRLFTPIGGSVVTEEEARWMSAYEPSESRPQPKSMVEHARTSTAELDKMLNGNRQIEDLPPGPVIEPPASGPDLPETLQPETDVDAAPSDAPVECEMAIGEAGTEDDVKRLVTEWDAMLTTDAQRQQAHTWANKRVAELRGMRRRGKQQTLGGRVT